MHASQGIIRVFFRVLLVGLVFLGRVQQELQKKLAHSGLDNYNNFEGYIMGLYYKVAKVKRSYY